VKVEPLLVPIEGVCSVLSGSLWDLSNVRTPNSGSVWFNKDL